MGPSEALLIRTAPFPEEMETEIYAFAHARGDFVKRIRCGVVVLLVHVRMWAFSSRLSICFWLVLMLPGRAMGVDCSILWEDYA